MLLSHQEIVTLTPRTNGDVAVSAVVEIRLLGGARGALAHAEPVAVMVCYRGQVLIWKRERGKFLLQK